MADTIQRVNYFPNQFLQVDDFTDEQTYHMEMRRKHNIVLHKWGIAEGLEVMAHPSKAATIMITGGVAIDEAGREIVMDSSEEKELSDFQDNAVLYVTVKYDEKGSATVNQKGVNGGNRWTEMPIVEVSDIAPDNDKIEKRLLLAKVTLDGRNVVQENIDTSARQLAGVKSDDLTVQSLKFKVPKLDRERWPNMCAGDDHKAEISGGLRIKDGPLKVESTAQIDENVQIGTDAKKATLDIRGTLSVDGTVEQCFSSEWFWVERAETRKDNKPPFLVPKQFTNPLQDIPSGFQMFYVYRENENNREAPTDDDPQYLVNTMYSSGGNGYLIQITKNNFTIYPGQTIAVYLDTESKPKPGYYGFYRFVCWKKKEIQKDLLIK
jgi:hypothetical protein